MLNDRAARTFSRRGSRSFHSRTIRPADRPGSRGPPTRLHRGSRGVWSAEPGSDRDGRGAHRLASEDRTYKVPRYLRFVDGWPIGQGRMYPDVRASARVSAGAFRGGNHPEATRITIRGPHLSASGVWPVIRLFRQRPPAEETRAFPIACGLLALRLLAVYPTPLDPPT